MKWQNLKPEQWLDYAGEPRACYPQKEADEAIEELKEFGKQAALINDELLDKRNEEAEAFTDKIHSLEYLLEQESRKHKRQMLLAMAKQAKYMSLYYRLEFMSTEGELFRRKWRQFELFRKKAKELE
jgi:hypothetical protein